MSDPNNIHEYVFVYGTLKKGFYNHKGRLDGTAGHSKFIKQDTIDGVMYDLGDFPGVVLYKKNDNQTELEHRLKIHGEVYEIDKNVLKKLDQLEGYPNFYNRSEIITDSGLKAWIYHMELKEVQNRNIVKNGIWQ